MLRNKSHLTILKRKTSCVFASRDLHSLFSASIKHSESELYSANIVEGRHNDDSGCDWSLSSAEFSSACCLLQGDTCGTSDTLFLHKLMRDLVDVYLDDPHIPADS